MSFKNGKYFQNIPLQAVNNAVTTVNKLSNVGIACFRYDPSASGVVSQNCFGMSNQGVNKPDSTLHTVPDSTEPIISAI